MTDVTRMPPYRSSRYWPGTTLLLAAAALLVAAFPAGSGWLQYDRLAIASGQLWRLLTSHWTHASSNHLFWDLLVFVVLGTLCEQDSRQPYLVCVGGAALLIPLALWCALPALPTYRGLSGIDAALFALLATTHLRRELHAQRWGWVVALAAVGCAFLAKSGYELATGNTLFVNSQAAHMIPVPLAHGVGAAVGLVVGLCRRLSKVGQLGVSCRRKHLTDRELLATAASAGQVLQEAVR